MAKPKKVIITCAVTGAIHTPSMSPHLPITPSEIIDDALNAAEAGAAILHVHARDPETGKPDQTPEAFGRFLPQMKQATSSAINITTKTTNFTWGGHPDHPPSRTPRLLRPPKSPIPPRPRTPSPPWPP